jgi:hypothetical protein
MAEQRIDITIDEDGKIKAATEGIKGELCLAQLEVLLGELDDVESFSKTDEFYQKQTVVGQTKLGVKGGQG